MKKTIISILTAVLAVSTLTNTSTIYAATTLDSEASVKFNSPDNNLILGDVPSIDFGSIDISNDEFNITSSVNSSLIVSDFRGTFEGWDVTAELSEFSNTERKEDDTLKAAELKLIDQNVKSSVDGENTDNLEDKTIVSNDESGPISVVNAIGTGAGVSTATWSRATLTVPNSKLAIASKGTHEATIKWTLNNGPQ